MRYWRQLLLLVIVIGLAPVALSQAPVAYRVPLTGTVRDQETGAPIAGARLSITDTEVVSGSDGAFSLTDIVIVTPIAEADVTVTAEGYQLWSFEGVALRADQPIEFRVSLQRLAPDEPLDASVTVEPTPSRQAAASSTPVPSVPVPTLQPSLPVPTLPSPTPPVPALLPPTPTQPSRTSARTVQTIQQPPEYISVGITGSSACRYDTEFLKSIRVERVRFVDYVRNVLPNEWLATWPRASLEAGAVAAKQFAWYNAFVRPKWRGRGYSFDVLDSTCDQVYKPGKAHPATDAAIASTWHLVLTRNGRLFETGYRAQDWQCPATVSCMGQWGSKYRADAGETTAQILLAYYRCAVLEKIGSGPVIPSDPTQIDPGQYRIYLPFVVNCGM